MRQIKSVLLSSVRPNSHNARTHSKKQIKQIAGSMYRFGWTSPILIDEDGQIIAGHGRYEAALLLGYAEVPVIIVQGLNDTEKRALALADNKIAANSGWDRELLAKELAELGKLLPEINLSLDLTGFDVAEVDSLLGDHIDTETDPVDQSPALSTTPISRRGDLWHLHDHCLLCGDALAEADMARLMGNSAAFMVITDVPYNLQIKKIVGRGQIKHKEFAQASGEMTPRQFTRFLRTALNLAARHSTDGSIHYVFIDWRHIGELLAATAKVYSELKNMICWVKSNAGMGTFYRSQHELIFVFKNGEAHHANNFGLGNHGKNRTNVWNYPGGNSFRTGRLSDLAMHPTVKPVAMIADAMRDCSRRGDVVLDPFMGSGTTIMAAERVGRRAFGLEIDPLYVDVSVRRWQAFTKRDAVLAGTGLTFDEVAAERSHIRSKP